MSTCLCLCMLALNADPSAVDKELVEAWLKVSRQHAQDYVIHPEGPYWCEVASQERLPDEKPPKESSP